jgi:hypothetical protein
VAANTWELERDLGLARARKDTPEIIRLWGLIQIYQTTCDHEPNPEAPYRCWKCGFALTPGPKKVQLDQSARKAG